MLPLSLALAALALAGSAAAHPDAGHLVELGRRLPHPDWAHPPDARVRELFRRQDITPFGINDPQFASQYPPAQGVPNANESAIPAPWLAAYNAAKSAGLIPNIPVTTIPPGGGNPVYPNGLVGTDPTVCTFTLKCSVPSDVINPPNGTLVVTFDDGPVLAAEILYPWLLQHSIPSTHFMIGRVILGDLFLFMEAYTQNQASIAVHTWSHPMMTTQTDLQQVAEIGWTMQLIHDLTGGRVPRFWRPPLGDCDLRCRAIAEVVFNLTTILWNNDSEDWRLSLGTVTGPEVWDNITNWVNGPKQPGLMILEHELTNDTVGIFMNTTYPLAVKNGWTLKNVPQMLGVDFYQNAADDVGSTTTSLPIALPTNLIAHQSAQTSGSMGTAGGAGPGGSATSGGAGPAKTGTGAAHSVRAGVASVVLAAALAVVAL